MKARRELLKEQLSEGDFVDKTSSLLNIAVVAQCKLLKDLSQLDYDLFLQEIEDYDELKYERLESRGPSSTS